MRLNNKKANIFRQTWGCPKNLHNIQICLVWLSWGPQLDSQNHVLCRGNNIAIDLQKIPKTYYSEIMNSANIWYGDTPLRTVSW